MPALSRIAFVIILSMQMVEPIMPLPTYGIQIKSNIPCKRPSSPFVPCMSGKITSGFIGNFSSHSTIFLHIFSGWRSICVSLGHVYSCDSSRSKPSACGHTRHCPVFIMPILIISYFSLLNELNTLCAESRDTLCSKLLPQKMSNTTVFDINIYFQRCDREWTIIKIKVSI